MIQIQIKDCPKSIKDMENDKSLEINNISEKKNGGNEKFFKDVIYEIIFTDRKFDLLLDTFLDTDSLVRFMEKLFVPEVVHCSNGLKMSEYKGIIDIGLHFLGLVRTNIKMNYRISNNLSIVVVPDTTMKSSVVLGRDITNSYELELKSSDSSDSVRAINEILSINVENELAKITESLDINPEIEFKTHSLVTDLFSNQYLIPERPEVPHVFFFFFFW